MAVLAIEADPRQASALRHIVCDLLKSRLMLVDSVASAVHALSAETPDLILLPPIISPGDEAELLRAIRGLPEAAHVEMHVTPMLESPAQTAHAADRSRSGRRPAGAEPSDDPEVRAFAAQVSSSLERARQHQRHTGGKHERHSHKAARASLGSAKPQAPHAIPRRHVRVAGPFDGFRRGAIDTPVLIQDLSEGGCFVNCVHSSKHDGEVTLGIQLPNERWITVKAEIVRSMPGFGFGVRFVEIPEAARAELARVIAERGQVVQPESPL
jgi:PilZ domain-containing protein